MKQRQSLAQITIVVAAICASVALFLLMESTTPRERSAEDSTARSAGTGAAPRPREGVAGEGAARSSPLPYAADRAPVAESPPQPPRPAPGTEELFAAELQRRMAKAVSDLEWSPGLPEPRQMNVAPAPEPWRPVPGAALPSPTIAGVSPATAKGGAVVRIRGGDFRSAQVVFGELPAEVVVRAPTELTVVAPQGGEGAVTVAVTNGDGTYAIAEGAFTYRE
jgi:hypothetical protein